MYCDHVPTISAYMRASPDNFMRGALFALLSIRQPFNRVPDQLAEVSRIGDQSPALFGHKLAAYRYLKRHKVRLHKACTADDTAAALEAICAVPGFGVVKGAFVLQLAGHDVACLDSRNIEREGRDPREFRSDSRIKQSKRWPSVLRRYLTETGGKARHYWDAWCDYVGPDYGMTTEECSAVHLTIVTQDCGRIVVPRGSVSPIGDIPF